MRVVHSHQKAHETILKRRMYAIVNNSFFVDLVGSFKVFALKQFYRFYPKIVKFLFEKIASDLFVAKNFITILFLKQPANVWADFTWNRVGRKVQQGHRRHKRFHILAINLWRLAAPASAKCIRKVDYKRNRGHCWNCFHIAIVASVLKRLFISAENRQ